LNGLEAVLDDRLEVLDAVDRRSMSRRHAAATPINPTIQDL
jgi:hypothetical protein